MKIIPLHDNILVKKQDETETMYGNIIVPDAGKEKVMMGKIIAVGPGKYSVTGQEFLKTTLKVDQLVTFPSFGGQHITIEGEDYLIYKELDIFAILEK